MNPLHDIPDDWQHADIVRASAYDQRKECALDVGAHRGVVTRKLLELYPQVVAVEPTELCSLVPALANRHRMALGAAAGRAGLGYGKHNTGQTHLVPGEEVLVTTLDILCETHGYKPTFVKVDVEGMEYDVLRGGEQTINLHRPVVMIEENGLSQRYGHRTGAAGALLESWGFKRVLVLRTNAPDEDWIYKWNP